MSKHFWTNEQLQFLREQYPKFPRSELLIKVNAHFNLEITLKQLEACFKNHKIYCGRSGQFKKGQPTWNKGMKGLRTGGEAGWFKKGQMPTNYRPVGSERINLDDYIEIKVKDPRTWRLKHRYVWEQANGPIPKSHVVIFLDQNKMNCTLDNLAIIPRAKLARMCQNGLFFNQAESTKVGMILADVYTKVGERKKELKERSKK